MKGPCCAPLALPRVVWRPLLLALFALALFSLGAAEVEVNVKPEDCVERNADGLCQKCRLGYAPNGNECQRCTDASSGSVDTCPSCSGSEILNGAMTGCIPQDCKTQEGNCGDCDGNNECTECVEGYKRVDAGDGGFSCVWEHCFNTDSPDPLCQACDVAEPRNCAECKPGSGATTLPGAPGASVSCARCEGNTISAGGTEPCTPCDPGKIANAEKTLCIAAPCEDQNCELCPGAVGVCTKCKNGFGLLTSEDPGKVTCESCGPYASGDGETCTDCSAGLVASEDGASCVEADPTGGCADPRCDLCSEYRDACLKCPAGHGIIDGHCVQCLGDTVGSGTDECTPCAGAANEAHTACLQSPQAQNCVVSNCKRCSTSDEGECVLCASGYSLSGDGRACSAQLSAASVVGIAVAVTAAVLGAVGIGIYVLLAKVHRKRMLAAQLAAEPGHGQDVIQDSAQ